MMNDGFAGARIELTPSENQAPGTQVWGVWCREIGILLPNIQRQHRALHIQKDVLPYALC